MSARNNYALAAALVAAVMVAGGLAIHFISLDSQIAATTPVQTRSAALHSTLWLGAWFMACAGTLVWLLRRWLKLIAPPVSQITDRIRSLDQATPLDLPAPETRELALLFDTLNEVSNRVSEKLALASTQLESLQQMHRFDESTGLLNRKHFLSALADQAARHDDPETDGGTLAIIRLCNLTELNQEWGRNEADQLLVELGVELQNLAQAGQARTAGRLNGSEFALLVSGANDASGLGGVLAYAMHSILENCVELVEPRLAIGVARFLAGEPVSHILNRIDAVVAAAEQRGPRGLMVDYDADTILVAPPDDLRVRLANALREDGVRLGRFPVLSHDGRLLHYEAPARLRLNSEWRNACSFLPWFGRLDMLDSLDLAVLHAALDDIEARQEPLAINVAGASLEHPDFRAQVIQLLGSKPDAARKLWLESPEQDVIRHLDAMRGFAAALRPLGCHLGVEHSGRELSRLGYLQSLGFDYVKLDASVVRGIDQDESGKTFVRGFCMVMRAIRLVVIAEGVTSIGERDTLIQLGVDALTGPAIDVSTEQTIMP